MFCGIKQKSDVSHISVNIQSFVGPELETAQVASEAGGPHQSSRAADRGDIIMHFCILSKKMALKSKNIIITVLHNQSAGHRLAGHKPLSRAGVVGEVTVVITGF